METIPRGLTQWRLKKMSNRALEPLGLKVCNNCGKLKWIKHCFTKKEKQSNCDPCFMAYNRKKAKEFRKRNPEKVKNWNKKWWQENGKEYHRNYERKK